MQDATDDEFDEGEDAGDDSLPSELASVEPDDYSRLPDDEVDEPDPALDAPDVAKEEGS